MAVMKSFGATEEVTGSCHLFELNGKKILIDCGMFQGEEEELNEQDFGFKPYEVDFILVSHAHLDHVGRIPKLVKEGFKGKIYATAPTKDLAYVILQDSAKLMHEEYETRFKKAQRRALQHKVQKPYYEFIDVLDTFNLEWVNVEYDSLIRLCDEISAEFHNAGHILGSAFIELNYVEYEIEHTIVFSGDIGNDNDLVMPNLAQCKKADYLYVESTYGDRNHQPIDATINEFKKILLDTLNNEGNVLIPSFAVERTQELLCILREMYENDELPKCKVFLDSPMATKATEVYRNYPEQLSRKCRLNIQKDDTVFNFDALVYTQTPEASKAINDVKSGAIIIAGSGMCNGGRILHHFKHRIWDEKNAVIFVGYQAVGTLGRKIIEGEEFVNIYNEDIIVKASIHTINGFSAHADQEGILEWIAPIQNLQKIFLVHGEKEKQQILKDVLEKKSDFKIHIVKNKERIDL